MSARITPVPSCFSLPPDEAPLAPLVRMPSNSHALPAIERSISAEERAEQMRKAARIASQSHIILGDQFVQKGDLDTASRQYDQACKSCPENGLAHMRLGVIQLMRKLHDASITELTEACRLLPYNAHAHQLLGESHLVRYINTKSTTDDLRSAKEALEKAIANDDTNFNIYTYIRLSEVGRLMRETTSAALQATGTKLYVATSSMIRMAVDAGLVQAAFVEKNRMLAD